jgi:hypothetical protein
MVIEDAQQQIDREFENARLALTDGNDGRARVCARRAAGVAIGVWLLRNRETGWPADAMNRIRLVRGENSMPEEVRNAAARLIARVTPDFTSPIDTDPVEDALILVRHFLHPEQSGES